MQLCYVACASPSLPLTYYFALLPVKIGCVRSCGHVDRPSIDETDDVRLGGRGDEIKISYDNVLDQLGTTRCVGTVELGR